MTKKIKLKNLTLGGGSPISVQSMLSCSTMDRSAVFDQIDRLQRAGCDIIRLAVESPAAVEICKEYIAKTKAVLVADIQFDYRLAVMCSDIGFDKIRFNPGNVGGENRIKEIVSACKANGTAIRIGANSGSLEKGQLDKCGGSLPRALAQSALESLRILQNMNFEDIVLSVKSSNLKVTVEANRLLSDCGYPLHIGVTESGRAGTGVIKSAIGIGALLLDGIGDTVRVSLTGDPVQEVVAAKNILRALGLLEVCEIVSCPTCSRCKCDLEDIVKQAEQAVAGVKKKMKIAVMGCAVNGPGEAADADFGAAFGDGNAVLFKHGKIFKTVEKNSVMDEIKLFVAEFAQ